MKYTLSRKEEDERNKKSREAIEHVMKDNQFRTESRFQSIMRNNKSKYGPRVFVIN